MKSKPKHKRKHSIVVPKVAETERIQGLLPEEVAFIKEEIAQRTQRQWSMEEVARRAQLQRQEISHLEHWRRSLTLATAIKIGRAYCRQWERFAAQSRRWLHALLLLLPEPPL